MAKIAIIPARGGSKRIPGKNTKDFLGKPIIAYSIASAIGSALFDEVMVSTDDDRTAEIARSLGASVPFFRSAKNSDDHVGTTAVMKEVLETYALENINFKYVCCIYPTAPLCRPGHLVEGYEKLVKENFDVVFPVAPFGFPVLRGLRMKPDGSVSMIWPEHLKTRSQDLEPVYHDAGQWYWFREEVVHSDGMPESSGAFLLSEHEVQDIDNPSDWALAELKYKLNFGAKA